MTTVEQLRKEICALRDGGTPWRRVAEHYGGDVSYATIQRIAEGHEPSAETCRRLGVRKTDRYRLHYEGGRGDNGRQRVEQVRAWLRANEWESLTEAIDDIMEVGQ